MIKIEDVNYSTTSFLMAIQGMRNPMNSWDKSDSGWSNDWPSDHGILIESDSEGYYECRIGPNDQELMLKLAKAGAVHAKYRRMITVYADITAPLYWWKEFDTYKVGTVANSCSTMHKIQAKEFELDDFSHEHLDDAVVCCKEEHLDPFETDYFSSIDLLNLQIKALNYWRNAYLNALKTEEHTGLPAKDIWWQMIQLLPSSYNQKRTVMLNYEVLAHIYHDRKDHKLDEWRTFCEIMKDQLPLSELFTLEDCHAK